MSVILSMLNSFIIYFDILFIIYHFFYMLSFYSRQFFFKKWAQILILELVLFFINANILFVGIIIQLLLSASVLLLSDRQSKKNYDVLITLGYVINHNQLNDTLRYRLDLLIDNARLYNSARIILCGGLSDSNDISEAQLMESYLIQKGIDPRRIIKEDKSATTIENIENAKAFLKADDSVLLISSFYHCLRARYICHQKGINVDSAGSKFPLRLLSNELLLEKYCLLREFIKAYLSN